MKYTAILLGLLAACGDDANNNNPVIHDMAVKPTPDANEGVPIGGQCSLSTDCKMGTNPSCRKNAGTPTGACTADCQTDSDCGDGNVCLFQPAAGSTMPGACAKSCQTATDCTQGIACWVTLDKVACWPLNGVQDGAGAIVLNCDPTVAGCTFKTTPLPGGCERQVLGPGNAGVCRQGCDIGVGTCPNYGATPQSCYLIDDTIDSMNMPTGDVLKQPICVIVAPVGTPPAFIADGAECLDPDSMNHFFDICLPGSQCELSMTASGGMPDNKCHPLCYIGNFSPPDMGAFFGDGGSLAGACPGGTTCTDVFGTTGATAPDMPVGLCI